MLTKIPFELIDGDDRPDGDKLHLSHSMGVESLMRN